MPKYSREAHDLNVHFNPIDFRDKISIFVVKILRFFADIFFKNNYAKRAIMLETVAAVPGMVAGTLQHLSILRRMSSNKKEDWIPKLIDEAENERMHLMVFLEISKPNKFDRFIVFMVQGIFFNLFFLLYLISPKTAHRIVGYFEEEAVISYTQYLNKIESGDIKNIAVPEWANEYWSLPNCDLKDLVIAIRNDEAEHRDVNHYFANEIDKTKL
jgi:ubiquinol oxidase